VANRLMAQGFITRPGSNAAIYDAAWGISPIAQPPVRRPGSNVYLYGPGERSRWPVLPATARIEAKSITKAHTQPTGGSYLDKPGIFPRRKRTTGRLSPPAHQHLTRDEIYTIKAVHDYYNNGK
jgi:hypothetical protein